MPTDIKQRVTFTRQQYEYLNKMYPEHVGNQDSTEAEYRFRAGQRAVVLMVLSKVTQDPLQE